MDVQKDVRNHLAACPFRARLIEYSNNTIIAENGVDAVCELMFVCLFARVRVLVRALHILRAVVALDSGSLKHTHKQHSIAVFYPTTPLHYDTIAEWMTKGERAIDVLVCALVECEKRIVLWDIGEDRAKKRRDNTARNN